MKINNFSISELLALYSDIIEELKDRKIIRTKNNIVADYAEYLVAANLNLKLMPNSNKHFDAIDEVSGKKFQIKSRRITDNNKSKLLGVIRDIDKADFDYLAVVYFDNYFKALEAYKIPKIIVEKYAKYNKHQNGHRISVKGGILLEKLVEKIYLV